MSVEERMNQRYDAFSDNDKYIAQCILRHKQDCIHLPIEEFAQRYHISKSALSRFAQKLELSGYRQLRSLLRLDAMKPKESTSSFLDVAIHNYHAMVEDMRKKDFTSLFQKFDQAKRILIFASGDSQARVASEFKRIFLPAHLIIYDMYGSDKSDAFCTMVQPDDLVILISLDGETPAILQIAQTLRLRSISLVSITRMKMNALAQLCEENLYIHSIEVPASYQIAYEITTPYFILIELLFLQYQQHQQTAQIPTK